MKKIIWIWNHYATNTFFERGGRHYWMAKYLRENGYDARVFCASTIHNSDEIIEMGEGCIYKEDRVDDIPYVFIKTSEYMGNGKSRIKNMVSFYKSLFPVSKEYSTINGAPDVILASSVHPLTLVAGIKIAKKFGVPCICEVRDLWPESIVAYTRFTENNPAIKVMYHMEKWIYKKADALIFTFEGGYDYIVDKGWDKKVNMSKTYYVNNAIDVEQFDKNVDKYRLENEYLNRQDIFKVIYTGSIREANGILTLARCAKSLKPSGIYFLIFGDGEERKEIEKICKTDNINNMIFFGKVDRKYIPYVLSNGDLNILNYKKGGLWKYGGSQNKFFEYLASGKPIISNLEMGYDPIMKYKCGIAKSFDNLNEYSEAIESIKNMSAKDYDNMCENARSAAFLYDHKVLGEKIKAVIDMTLANEERENDNERKIID